MAMLLVLCMVISVVPMNTYAEETNATESTKFDRILHLDCGRKYFTKDWIIALINEMAAAGYNQLQLAFGNDGLRFLLNNMSFEANGISYEHSTVVSKVEVGNKAQNNSNDSRWLTQAEMDSIVAHADSKGIEIVETLDMYRKLLHADLLLKRFHHHILISIRIRMFLLLGIQTHFLGISGAELQQSQLVSPDRDAEFHILKLHIRLEGHDNLPRERTELGLYLSDKHREDTFLRLLNHQFETKIQGLNHCTTFDSHKVTEGLRSVNDK